ncbi:uncharacterized protein AAG666_003625 isoform 1-T1 [Megaptera novaeangliae]
MHFSFSISFCPQNRPSSSGGQKSEMSLLGEDQGVGMAAFLREALWKNLFTCLFQLLQVINEILGSAFTAPSDPTTASEWRMWLWTLKHIPGDQELQVVFFYLAAPCSILDLSSLTTD